MATNYTWIKRATNGGGRANDGCVDHQIHGHVACMGDLWGAHLTSDYGDNWHAAGWGVKPHASGAAGDGYGRGCIFSLRPATAGALYVGTGTLTGGPDGHFAVIPNGSLQQQIVDASNGFATTYSPGPGGNWPRPSGGNIFLDYDGINDVEYIFTYNVNGLQVYKNGGGKNIFAAQAPTLLAGGTVNGALYKTGCLGYDAQHAFLGTYPFSLSLTPQSSSCYLVSTSSTRLGVATSGTTTVTDISSHIPGTKKLNWLQNANSSVYAACDDGVYLVNSTGTTWTSLGFPTNGGNPSCVRYSATTGNLYVWCGTDASGNSRVIAKGVGSGTTWTWTWIFTGTNWSATEFGTGNTWWLNGSSGVPTGPAFGSMAGDVVNVGGTDFLFTFGYAGIHASRDGGATWQPCSNGAGGGICLGLNAGTGGAATYQDKDYGTATTPNHFTTVARGGTSTANVPLSVTKNGHTFTVAAPTAPPCTATLDGVSVADDNFRGAVVAPASVDMSSETPPYLYVGLFGGGVITGIPNTTPVAPVGGRPTLTTDTPIEGIAVTVLENAASWGGNPPPTFSFTWFLGTSALGPFTSISGATSSSYTPLAQDVGMVLKCTVQATNIAGNALGDTEITGLVAASGSGSGDVTPPTTPTWGVNSPSPTEIDLSWAASTDSGGSGLGGYRINRSLDGGANYVVAGSVGPSTTTFQDTGLQPNTPYTYTITAFDNAGNVTTSAAITASTTATQSGGDQTVSITQPTQNQVFTQQQEVLKATVVPGSFPIVQVTVTINGGIELQLTQDPQVTNGWTKTIALAAGANTIVVRAYDSTGAIVSSVVQASFSTTNQGPSITFLTPLTAGLTVNSNSYVVQVDVEDADGIDPTSVQVSTDGITWTTMSPPTPLTGGG